MDRLVDMVVACLPLLLRGWIEKFFPEWSLPTRLALKTCKEGWDDEFDTEKLVYKQLKHLQGNRIPTYYGELKYKGTKAILLSDIGGVCLGDPAGTLLDREKLGQIMADAFNDFAAYGVIPGDMRLENFRLVDGKVMAVDFEMVDRPDTEDDSAFLVDFIWPSLDKLTHCAGSLGSKTYGVAKKTKLCAIKAFDKNGHDYDTGIIASMDKVIEDAKTRDCPKGITVSMSFGTETSQSVNDAAKALVNAGFFAAAAAAAGNGDINGRPVDASPLSPASETSICTVGASQIDDKIASFSKYGQVGDIFASGVNVLSLKPNGGATKMNGMSMATPHIAGLGGYFL
ncbi:hypothetical protein QQS21_012143 [Conoideocrella luteorostrata]|uniref:Peptidase S8/S53 domain-containing protein n=1 Tax=Conoideocrella luteorostrata TaxID=1105319 RepID=A0AAJ0CEK8_9HYPO|nr:hypothetical protein QQS21_012143 [Conoideocrella luteorostrata]